MSTNPVSPAKSAPDDRRHVMEPEVHPDLLSADAAPEAGKPGNDENAPGFIKPKEP
jgi:hypothetical protein